MKQWLRSATDRKQGSRPVLSMLLLSPRPKKLIVLFFGAKWCQRSQDYMQMLVPFYARAKAADPEALEIVFISSDPDQVGGKAPHSEALCSTRSSALMQPRHLRTHRIPTRGTPNSPQQRPQLTLIEAGFVSLRGAAHLRPLLQPAAVARAAVV